MYCKVSWKVLKGQKWKDFNSFSASANRVFYFNVELMKKKWALREWDPKKDWKSKRKGFSQKKKKNVDTKKKKGSVKGHLAKQE